LRLTAASNGTLGTHFRIGPTGAGNWLAALVSPAGDTSKADQVTGDEIPPFPTTTFASLKSWRVEGANPGSPDTTAKTVLAGLPGAGALFAVAVVPTGAYIHIFSPNDGKSGIAADKGPIEQFEYIEPFDPEPGT